MPTEWEPMEVTDVPRPPAGVQFWISGACGLMVTAGIFSCWALVHDRFEAAAVLLVATLLSAGAMLAGIDYAACEDDEEG